MNLQKATFCNLELGKIAAALQIAFFLFFFSSTGTKFTANLTSIFCGLWLLLLL